METNNGLTLFEAMMHVRAVVDKFVDGRGRILANTAEVNQTYTLIYNSARKASVVNPAHARQLINELKPDLKFLTLYNSSGGNGIANGLRAVTEPAGQVNGVYVFTEEYIGLGSLDLATQTVEYVDLNGALQPAVVDNISLPFNIVRIKSDLIEA